MNVGLVAHDGKKNLMQNLCIAYQDILKKHKLYATSTPCGGRMTCGG